jgi:hypothetical protein
MMWSSGKTGGLLEPSIALFILSLTRLQHILLRASEEQRQAEEPELVLGGGGGGDAPYVS